MLNSKGLRAKAWDSLKGKYWTAFLAVLISGILCSGESLFVTYADKMDVSNAVDPSKMDYAAMLESFFTSVKALGAAFIGLIFGVFISSPFTIGCCNFFVKNTNSKPALSEIFSGFRTKYGRNIKTMLLVSIKTALWTLLFIIPGIIKGFEYAIIPYILADEPEISSKDAFKKANQMMKGNKWRLFKLEFSFIGWFVLCVLTLGVGTFFLVPYVNAASAEFYVELKNN